MPQALSLALLLTFTRADAHELPTSTARLSLRDAALEIVADIDPLPLLTQLEAKDLASLTDEELASLLSRAKQALTTETRLLADGRAVDLTLTVSIEAKEVLDLLALSPEDRHARARLVPLRWEVMEPLASTKQLSLTLPPALGPVLVSFVQPQSRYATPGSTASFSVLESPSNAQASEMPKRRRWAEGAVMLALLALGFHAIGFTRRKPVTAR